MTRPRIKRIDRVRFQIPVRILTSWRDGKQGSVGCRFQFLRFKSREGLENVKIKPRFGDRSVVLVWAVPALVFEEKS